MNKMPSAQPLLFHLPAKTKEKMDQMRMADAVTEVFNIFRRCNKYIDETEPWVLAKDEANRNRLSEVMYNLVEGICIGANLLKPYARHRRQDTHDALRNRKRF